MKTKTMGFIIKGFSFLIFSILLAIAFNIKITKAQNNIDRLNGLFTPTPSFFLKKPINS